MTIVLVRHGETALNAARTLQPADTPLSVLGRRQAWAVARRLRDEGAAGLVSSDLPRARETAEAVATAAGLPLEVLPLLQERNFGDLRGRPYDTLGFDPLQLADAPPGGESWRAFAERCAEAFAHLQRLQTQCPGRLVVVTHGLVIRQILAGHAPAPAGSTWPPIGNTAVTVIAAAPPHPVTLLNCTRHLDLPALHEGATSLSGG